MALDDYLQQALCTAELVGSGHFSLEPVKALRKRAQFTLPQPTDWALKLVQSAVASGAPALSARLHLTRFCAEFSPQPTWTRQQLLDALCDPEPCAQRAMDHLRTALWDCFGHQRPFRLDLPDLSLQFDGRWLKEVPLRSGVAGVRLEYSLGQRGEWCKVHPEVRAGLVTALRQACPLCPIPLTLDGQRLEGVDLALNPAHSIPLALTGCDGTRLPLPMRSQFEKLVPPALRPSVPHPARVDCVCLVAYHLDASRRSLVHFIRDGVRVDSAPLVLPAQQVCADIFCSADSLRADLSGLTLVRGDDWLAHCARVPEYLAPRIAQLQLDQDELSDAIAYTLRHRGNQIAQKWTSFLDFVEEAHLGSQEFHRRLRNHAKARETTREARTQLLRLQAEWALKYDADARVVAVTSPSPPAPRTPLPRPVRPAPPAPFESGWQQRLGMALRRDHEIFVPTPPHPSDGP